MTATSANEAPYDDVVARKNVLLLSGAQALAGANSAVIMTTGAIVGSILAPRLDLATLPVSFYVVGTALGTLPAGMIARKWGRNAAFTAGTACGVIVGLLAALAIYLGSFALFCLATFIGGFYQAVGQTFRFAAADQASPDFRPKAVSWVMAGGVFAAILGPQLVNITMELWAPYLFMASFFVQALVSLVCMALLSQVRIPHVHIDVAHRGRPLVEIIRQPRFIIAVFGATTAYALMNMLMTSAPLAMKLCGLSLSDATWGIQWHIVAMFLPSFWTGDLIRKFGAARIVATGLMLIALAGLVGLSGVTNWHFWIGLVLLGLGWNFGFVGGSAMVLETHRPEERSRVQSFNDFLIFGTMAIASFSSGQILANWGWDYLNWIVFPPVALTLILIAFSRSGSSDKAAMKA
jgi:predicted MFS family arabinose efflux permease